MNSIYRSHCHRYTNSDEFYRIDITRNKIPIIMDEI